jgi:hypothetical protein
MNNNKAKTKEVKIGVTTKYEHTREVVEEDNYFVVELFKGDQRIGLMGWIEKTWDEEQFKRVSKEQFGEQFNPKIGKIKEFGKDFEAGRKFIENSSSF